MKRSYCLMGFLAFLCCVSTAQAGPFDDFNIYYINGVQNSQSDAADSKRELNRLILPDAPTANVNTLYQWNDKLIAELYEVYRQSYSDGSREKYKNFWLWLNKLNLAPDAFIKNILYPTLAKYDERTYTQNPDLQAMISELKRATKTRKKTILIAHSQGNFFANQIVSDLQTSSPDLLPCVGVVAIATPATYVAGSGPYTTLANDMVINLGRAAFPWSPLPASPTTPVFNTKDLSGHLLVPSYLETLPSRIRSQILDVANRLNQTCVAPPSSCGAPISSTGSSGTRQYLLTIGQGAQSVTANFEAYSIPDGLVLSANGVKLAGTNGLVSGYNSYTFTFDSQKFGTTQLWAEVTGNTDPGTAWALCVDCNNPAGSTCGPSLQTRSVNIDLSYNPYANEWLCTTGNMTVDNMAIGSIVPGKLTTVPLTPGSEPHQLLAPQAGCACLKRLGCFNDPKAEFQFTYKDGAGKPVYFATPLTNKYLNFVIQ